MEPEVWLRVIDLGVAAISLVVMLVLLAIMWQMMKMLRYALEGQQDTDKSEQAERQGLVGMIETLIIKWGHTLDALGTTLESLKQAFEAAENSAQKRHDQALILMSQVPGNIDTIVNQISEQSTAVGGNRTLLDDIKTQLTDLALAFDKLPTTEEFQTLKTSLTTLIERLNNNCDRLEAVIVQIESKSVERKEEQSDESGQLSGPTGSADRSDDDRGGIDFGDGGTDPGAAGERGDPGAGGGVRDLADQERDAGDQVEQPADGGTPRDHPGDSQRSDRTGGISGGKSAGSRSEDQDKDR